MIKKDNHYVSDMYLRAWAGGRGVLQTYRVLVSHTNESVWKERSPKAVAYHRNLYTRMAAGGETDDVETWFDTEFETPAGKPFKRALSDRSLTPDEWVCIVRFLAAQDARTPARMFERLRNWNETMEAFLNECLEDSVKELEEYSRTGMKVPTVRDAVDLDLFPVRTIVSPGSEVGQACIRTEATIGRSLWLWSLKQVLTKTLSVLHQHRWTILRSPPGIEWLTSDNPVIRLNYSSPAAYNFQGGWGSPGTEIMMPLSPKHLLYTRIGAKRVPARGTVMSNDFATQIRRFTVENAHRYVFSQTADPDVPAWRPRTVDPAASRAEREFWESWNSRQVEAERAYLTQRRGIIVVPKSDPMTR